MANEKIAEAVVGGYKKIEEVVVEGYKKIESGVVEGFEKVTNKCVEKLFAKDGHNLVLVARSEDKLNTLKT